VFGAADYPARRIRSVVRQHADMPGVSIVGAKRMVFAVAVMSAGMPEEEHPGVSRLLEMISGERSCRHSAAECPASRLAISVCEAAYATVSGSIAVDSC